MKVYAICAHKIKGQIWGSKILMWFQGLSFSHVCLLFDSGSPFIFESVAPFSRSIDFKKWSNEYELVKKYLVADIDPVHANIFVQTMDGIPYSKTQLLVIFLNSLIRSIFNKAGLISIDNGDLICTEVYTMFIKIFRGYYFKEKKDLVDLIHAEKSMQELEIKS